MIDVSMSVDILKRIGSVSLQRYALSHGWERKNLPERFKIALYRRPEDPNRELLLPQSEEFGDYLERIADFVSGLASFESVPINHVLNALLNPQADVLRFGYRGPESNLGFVPFLTGISLFDAALRSLSTATYDVIKPERFHARMSNTKADAYIESCRMGQTERASFVISCICPVEPASQLPVTADDEQLVEEVPAFGRRVTQHIMRSVAQINEFVLADRVNRLVEPEPGDIVISGNFFESLMAFPVEQEAASLYITAEWDRSLAQPVAPQRTEVRYDMFPAIDEVARQLRPTKSSKEDKFIAKVISLRGELNLEEQMEGEVTLLLLHLDTSLKAKVWLNASDYAAACDAHKMNKYVAIVGTLSRFRKTNQFDGYTSFQIFPD
jgi:hypothetical protein